MMADLIRTEWGRPIKTLLDRFRMYQLEDCARGLRLEPRVTRYSEASADIRALRKYAKDGPLAVERDSRLLLTASLTAAQVETDGSGNTRMSKKTGTWAAMTFQQRRYWRLARSKGLLPNRHHRLP